MVYPEAGFFVAVYMNFLRKSLETTLGICEGIKVVCLSLNSPQGRGAELPFHTHFSKGEAKYGQYCSVMDFLESHCSDPMLCVF